MDLLLATVGSLGVRVRLLGASLGLPALPQVAEDSSRGVKNNDVGLVITHFFFESRLQLFLAATFPFRAHGRSGFERSRRLCTFTSRRARFRLRSS